MTEEQRQIVRRSNLEAATKVAYRLKIPVEEVREERRRMAEEQEAEFQEARQRRQEAERLRPKTWRDDPITDRQRALLLRMGVSEASMPRTKGEASAMIASRSAGCRQPNELEDLLNEARGE